MTTNSLEPLFTRHLRSRISSSPLLVDANDDGWPEVFVGGSCLQGLSWTGATLARWPKRSRKPFASSPAFGDINGDQRGEIVVGCDDGKLYAFHVDGDPVRGWPVHTGADVFSTPCLADLDRDGALEVVVGSDDGGLYTLKGDGRPLRVAFIRDRPFISASPTVFGGEDPSVVVGAWDHALYRWHPMNGAPPAAIHQGEHLIWSSATLFRLEGIGTCLAWASDQAHLADANGTPLPGWPQPTGSWMVASPTVVELQPGDGPTVLVGAERVYAWDLFGHPRPGWPVDAGDFVWASPIAFDVDGDGAREVLVGSWDGSIYAFRRDGSVASGFPLRTDGPIFATPAAAPLPTGGGLLVAASWDGTVRGWRLPEARFAPGDWLQFRGSPSRTGTHSQAFKRVPGEPSQPGALSKTPRVRSAYMETWAGLARVTIHGDGLDAARRLLVEYEISGERGHHPVPAVRSRDGFVAIVQPLRLPRRIRYHVELEDREGNLTRWPREGEATFISWPTVRRFNREPSSDPRRG